MELRDILSLLHKKMGFLIITMLIFMLAGALITAYLISPQYQAETTLIVNKSESAQDANSGYSYEDILLSQRLVNTYTIIITSDSVLNQVVNNLSLGISANELRNKLVVTGVNDTEVIKLTVVDNSPERAVHIANEIAKVAPDAIMRTVRAGSVELIDPASLPDKPVSPNIIENTIISGFLGTVIMALIIITREYYNRTIKTSEDIENYLNLPVLGQIPKF